MQASNPSNCRIIIYPKDVELITGKKERAARLLLQRIRKAFQKQRHQFITVKEFSEYTGIELQQVYQLLNIDSK